MHPNFSSTSERNFKVNTIIMRGSLLTISSRHKSFQLFIYLCFKDETVDDDDGDDDAANIADKESEECKKKIVHIVHMQCIY